MKEMETLRQQAAKALSASAAKLKQEAVGERDARLKAEKEQLQQIEELKLREAEAEKRAQEQHKEMLKLWEEKKKHDKMQSDQVEKIRYVCVCVCIYLLLGMRDKMQSDQVEKIRYVCVCACVFVFFAMGREKEA
jgi:hypothetical protein